MREEVFAKRNDAISALRILGVVFGIWFIGWTNVFPWESA